MNKYQEALQNFIDDQIDVIDSSEPDYCPYTTVEDIEALKELVDKATPKDVSWFTNQNGEQVDCCSRCKTKIKQLTNYCPHCGQALKWR